VLAVKPLSWSVLAVKLLSWSVLAVNPLSWSVLAVKPLSWSVLAVNPLSCVPSVLPVGLQHPEMDFSNAKFTGNVRGAFRGGLWGPPIGVTPSRLASPGKTQALETSAPQRFP